MHGISLTDPPDGLRGLPLSGTVRVLAGTWLDRLARVWGVAFLLLLLAGCSDRYGLEEVQGHPIAPELAVFDIDGKPFSSDRIKGKLAIVNFWATWCPPCREEMPSLTRAAEILAIDDGGVVVGIDVGEDANTVAEYLRRNEIGFPLALDPDGEAAITWGIRGLPTSFVLGPGGKIHYRVVGGRDWSDPGLLSMLRSLQ